VSVVGIDRKCRSCGRWTYFKAESGRDKSRCVSCGKEYGKITFGLDVTRFSGKDKVQKLPTARGQVPGVMVPKPKRGEYGA
jgi:hypothetical protein